MADHWTTQEHVADLYQMGWSEIEKARARNAQWRYLDVSEWLDNEPQFYCLGRNAALTAYGYQ